MSKIIVVIKADADRNAWIGRLNAAGLQWSEYHALPQIFVVDGTTAATFPLAGDPAVESVEDDKTAFKGAEQTVTIDERQLNGCWALLRHIHRDPPWSNKGLRLPFTGTFACARTGLGVDFYSIDTGVEVAHPEFGSRVTIVYEPTDTGGVGDDNGHGTGTTGSACGATVGFARDALIFSCKGLDANNTGTTVNILNAINAALAHYNSRADTDRPAVMNMSLSGGSNSYETALKNCMNAGIVCVAAAGNDRIHLAAEDYFPAEIEGVICVGGTQMGDLPYNTGTSGSNYGTEVDILAASQFTWGATLQSLGAYRSWNGTSFGCGFTSGIVACMLQDYRRLTSRLQVQAVGNYLYEQATFGRYRPDPRQEPMTPAIAYLDPGTNYPPIDGLVLR